MDLEHRDELSPKRIAALLALDARRKDARRPEWRMLDAAYKTRFWEYLGQSAGSSASLRWGKWNADGTEVEVNRLWRGVTTYKAALYRRPSRIDCGPDAVARRGNVAEGSAVANAIWRSDDFSEQMDRAVEMAVLFPGCGFKVGVDEGAGSPLARAWRRVVPWWEVGLDADVTDPRDERFRYHRYWAPLSEVRERYELSGIQGGARRDYLADGSESTESADQNEPGGAGEPDDGEFVEVVELCNMKDSVLVKGQRFVGRLEVYVLGQGGVSAKDPVRVTPLAFADADGKGLPHIEPVIFNREPAYPYRAISPASRVLPQLRETNLIRTKMAQLLRSFARKGFKRRGVLSDDQMSKLLSANDMEFVDIDGEEVALDKVVYMLPNQPITAEFWTWQAIVDADYTGAWGQAQQAVGGSTAASKTAYAVQVEQFWTETELGYAGQALTRAVKRVLALSVRAVIHAMRTVKDAAASESPRAVTGPIEVVSGPAPETGSAAETQVDPEASLPVEAAEMVADGEASAAVVSGPSLSVEAFDVETDDGRVVQITEKGLDANFDYRVVDGARTPMADAAVLQFLTTQGPAYFAWFDLVVKGGPMGVLAREWMDAVAERASLPPHLRPEALLRRVEEEAAKAKEVPAKGPDPASFMPPGPTAEPSPEAPPVAEPNAALEQVKATPLFRALDSIRARLLEVPGSEGAQESVAAAMAALVRGDAGAVLDGIVAGVSALEGVAGAEDVLAALQEIGVALAQASSPSPAPENGAASAPVEGEV